MAQKITNTNPKIENNASSFFFTCGRSYYLLNLLHYAIARGCN